MKGRVLSKEKVNEMICHDSPHSEARANSRNSIRHSEGGVGTVIELNFPFFFITRHNR